MASRRPAFPIPCWALLATMCGSSGGATAPARLPADPHALPEFTLADYQHTLTGPQGMPVLVNIWASWCGPSGEQLDPLVT